MAKEYAIEALGKAARGFFYIVSARGGVDQKRQEETTQKKKNTTRNKPHNQNRTACWPALCGANHIFGSTHFRSILWPPPDFDALYALPPLSPPSRTASRKGKTSSPFETPTTFIYLVAEEGPARAQRTPSLPPWSSCLLSRLFLFLGGVRGRNHPSVIAPNACLSLLPSYCCSTKHVLQKK